MLSELSLTSEKSGERADLAQHPLRYARIRAPAATQTEPEAPRVNAAVNTTIVMDAFSFRCVACSKPPAKPKVALRLGVQMRFSVACGWQCVRRGRALASGRPGCQCHLDPLVRVGGVRSPDAE